MYIFRKVPQFPRIIFVEGSPASQTIAGGASICGLLLVEWVDGAGYKNTLSKITGWDLFFYI